jgi:hypothetical protein
VGFAAPREADHCVFPPACATPGIGSVGSEAAMASTKRTSAKVVLARLRPALLDQGSLCCTQRSITALGYTSLPIVLLTCSPTVSSTSIWGNLYIESSLVFCFLVVCQMGSFLVLVFPFLALSEM